MAALSTGSIASFVELLTLRAQTHPERLALRFLHDRAAQGEDLTLTYGELYARACSVAVQLSASAARGDRALLLFPNGPDYVTALFGCFFAGVVAVPAYPPQSLQPRHLARVAAMALDAKPTLLLTEAALLTSLSAAQTALPELAGIKVMATDTVSGDSAGLSPTPSRGADLAMLQYTSGSTSMPKGVMLTHANLLANEAAIYDAFSIQDDDVIVSWLPLFHDMGLIGTLLQPIYAGVSAVLMAPQRYMERPRRWLDAISRYRGTVSGAPDFAYRLCTQRVDPSDEPLDLSSWRLAFCGAEPVRSQSLACFAEKFAAAGFSKDALYPCYGLAEATLIVTGGRRGAGVRTREFAVGALLRNQATPAPEGRTLVSCGVARPAHRVVITDVETGSEVTAGAVGEILVQGPSVAAGYWNNHEASRHTFREREDGRFLHTGDLGFLLDDELYVTGRKKDLLIIRGQNLYPQDIERSVETELAAVRNGRAVAVALEHAGEEGIAIIAEIEPRLRKLIDPAKLARELTDLVARTYGEPPIAVVLVVAGAILLTSSGKLRRSACRDAWLAGELAVMAAYGPAAGLAQAPTASIPTPVSTPTGSP